MPVVKKQKRKRIFLNKPEGEPKGVLESAKPLRTLTEKLIDQFCRLAEQGIPSSVIADYLGIYSGAFHQWVAKGIKFQETGDPTLAIYGLFVRKHRRACAKYLMDRQELLHTADAKEYYREVVILERRDKKNWAKDQPQVNENDVMQPDEKFL